VADHSYLLASLVRCAQHGSFLAHLYCSHSVNALNYPTIFDNGSEPKPQNRQTMQTYYAQIFHKTTVGALLSVQHAIVQSGSKDQAKKILVTQARVQGVLVAVHIAGVATDHQLHSQRFVRY